MSGSWIDSGPQKATAREGLVRIRMFHTCRGGTSVVRNGNLYVPLFSAELGGERVKETRAVSAMQMYGAFNPCLDDGAVDEVESMPSETLSDGAKVGGCSQSTLPRCYGHVKRCSRWQFRSTCFRRCKYLRPRGYSRAVVIGNDKRSNNLGSAQHFANPNAM